MNKMDIFYIYTIRKNCTIDVFATQGQSAGRPTDRRYADHYID